MISGIILAAEENPRRDDLRQIVGALRLASVHDIVVVLGNHSGVGGDCLAGWFEGKHLFSPMKDSHLPRAILQAYEMLDQNDLHGAILCPSTQPCITQEVVVDVLRAFWMGRKRIVVPLVDGTRSVPIIVEKTVIEEMKNGLMFTAIEEIVDRHPDDVIEVSLRSEATKEGQIL